MVKTARESKIKAKSCKASKEKNGFPYKIYPADHEVVNEDSIITTLTKKPLSLNEICTLIGGRMTMLPIYNLPPNFIAIGVEDGICRHLKNNVYFPEYVGNILVMHRKLLR